MKRTLLLGIVLLLLMQSVSALVTGGSGLEATLLNYEPVPVQPGDIMDVWLLITNDGSKPVSDVTVELLDSYPFTTDNDAERFKRTNSIPAQESFLVKSKVRVDKNANIGNNFLRVQVREGNSGTTYDSDITIPITGETSSLVITEAYSTPAVIPPGTQANTYTLAIKNVGNQRLRNVNAELDLSKLNVAPGTGSNSKVVEILQPEEVVTFTYDLVAFPEAVTNIYQVPITLTYIDEDGEEQENERTVGLTIGSKPELLVYFERIDITEDASKGEVIIRFVNKGLNEIKLLEMEVMESEDVVVMSESSVVYVGNIDEDDYETADIMLEVDGETEVPVRIKYRDALNREYEEQLTLTLRPKPKEGNGGLSGGKILFLLILVGAGIWWWRKRRGKRKR